MHSITIRHNFEAAHRLPHLPGKCQSLHGHSFWADVTIQAATLDQGILLEYGQAKRFLREWVDHHWDHGSILGEQDDLVTAREEDGTPIREMLGKVYVMPAGEWPTVENLAHHLATVVEAFCRDLNRAPDRGDRPTIHVRQVHVQETHVNGADWHWEAGR